MTEKQMFDRLVAGGISEYGAAAVLGNFKEESGLNPRNLQDCFEGESGFTDDSYTAAVDSGEYNGFVHDSYGYGLAQWTFWSRKQALLDFAHQRGVSIGDAGMQIDFALQELRGYKAVWDALTSGTVIQDISDIVLEGYERPKDQSDAVKRKRAESSQAIYDRYASADKEGKGATEGQVRQRLVDIAVAWHGRKESDGSHKEIIDIYNGHEPLARGYRVKYTDAWCATFASAVAIKAGYTDIIPTECGCGQLVAAFQAIGRWVEDDAYIPSPGDYIFYDWDDTGEGDDTGWPEHVGIVVSVSGDTSKVIEGNKNDAVGYREVKVNGRYIRGYGVPDYRAKTVSKTPENVTETPENVIGNPENGTNSNKTESESPKTGTLCKMPQWTGIVAVDMLDVRKWAGDGYDKIKSYPELPKGMSVDVCDTIKAADGTLWYYIRINGRVYGFVPSDSIGQVQEGVEPGNGHGIPCTDKNTDGDGKEHKAEKEKPIVGNGKKRILFLTIAVTFALLSIAVCTFRAGRYNKKF